jgi:hypothetical protein
MDIPNVTGNAVKQKHNGPIIVLILFLVVLILGSLGLLLLLVKPSRSSMIQEQDLPEPTAVIQLPQGTPTPTMVPMPN